MPIDDLDGNDELGPLAGGDRGDPNRKPRRASARNLTSNWQKRAAADSRSDSESPLTAPALALPIGTAGQLEVLLAMRQQRLKKLLIRLGLFVVLPTFVVWFYTALIATPRFVSTFELTYQAYEPTTTLAAGLVQSEQGSSVMGSVDYGALLYEYIRSEAMAEKIDQEINFRQHYSSHRIDALSRLDANAAQPQFLAYWRDHVAVSEGFGGYLTIQVQGFDPAFTLLLAQTINIDADKMIDDLNQQARDAEVKSATAQLQIAATELKNANNALTVFRNSHGDLDPSYAATQLATIIGTLESNLALLQAQLQQSQANMQPGASQIVQLKLQVAALQQQITSERQRLSDATAPSYSDTVALYNDLLSDQQFANTVYQSAQQGLIIAQADAAAKQNYAVDFVPPLLPAQATLPDAASSSFTVFLVMLSLYGICNLLFAAFRDQSGI